MRIAADPHGLPLDDASSLLMLSMTVEHFDFASIHSGLDLHAHQNLSSRLSIAAM